MTTCVSDKQSLCRFFIKRQLVAQSVQVCHAAFGAEVCYEFYTDMLVVYRLVDHNLDLLLVLKVLLLFYHLALFLLLFRIQR